MLTRDYEAGPTMAEHPFLIKWATSQTAIHDDNMTTNINVGDKIPEGSFQYIPYSPDLADSVRIFHYSHRY